jgi:hypothetical protein
MKVKKVEPDNYFYENETGVNSLLEKFSEQWKLGRENSCIKTAKSFFNVSREKLSPRPLAAEADNLEDVTGFRGQGVHNIFCTTENLQ